MTLEIDHISCGYGQRAVVQDLSVKVGSGEVLCILGPNGVGKTTFFKTILGFLHPLAGAMKLDGEDVRSWSRKKLARSLAYVPQAHTPPFPFSVIDVVTMGRTAHLGALASPSPQDVALADAALDQLGIAALRNRVYTELSGGERQMVLIARALTQEPEVLLMDEPTSNLDFGNQVSVLEQVNRLADQGLTIVMTSHVPDHAFLCRTQVALLNRHQEFFVGDAMDIVSEENLKKAYGVEVRIVEVPGTGGEIRSCVPLLGRTRTKRPEKSPCLV